MHVKSALVPTALALAATGSAQNATAGFGNARTFDSQGGLATCVSGDVPITVTSPNNVVLKIPVPQNQLQVTQAFVNMVSSNLSLPSMMGGMKAVTGNYSIFSTLCVPKAGVNSAKAVQLLTHGVGFDQSYWDFSPELSYVDYAAKAGAATFLYDRLGIAKSSKPDPIQAIQAPMEVAIAHALVQKLKSGYFAGTTYKKVVGVGHSFGSVVSQGVSNAFPSDLDGVVLTGFTTNMTGLPVFLSALNLQIAAQNSPLRFSGLNNGFLVSQNVISNQFAFFHYPGFDATALAGAELTKQTVTFGELSTMNAVVKPAASYKNPVFVVNGEFDIPFCSGNCRVNGDQGTAVLKGLYPAVGANGKTTIIADSGHGINLHLNAPGAYTQIQRFLTNHAL